jgi:prepilin-type N-terminal cleavage/methylation domain-containing protein
MRTRAGQSGFTLVEMLISMVLLSIILAAIAAAIRGALTSYATNGHIADVNQMARVVLTRIRREVRRAESVDHSAPANKLVFFLPGDANEYVYEYGDEDKALVYRRKLGSVTTSYTLFDAGSPVRLESFNVSCTVATDPNKVAYTRRVRIQMGFACGQESLSAACSAAPRRNQDY